MSVAPKLLVILAGAAALLGTTGLSVKAQQPLVVNCEGPFGRNATRGDLVKAFPGNVVDRELGGPEGTKLKGSVVYPNDPRRRLEIIWNDEKARRGPTIRINQKSVWATASGVRLGLTLTEIERINGKPFKLYGFEWDFGGRSSNWQAGALGKPQPGGCNITVAFGYDDKARSADLDKVSGDSEFLSTNPSMRAVNPKVFEITLGFPRR
jgi:hypothetical protein